MHFLGQKINRVQTDGVRATVSLLLRSVKKSVTEDRKPGRRLQGLYLHFRFCSTFYWQSGTFFLIHLNLPGPPTVVWMIELHVFVYGWQITLQYTPLGEVACFSGKNSEKRKLSFEKFSSCWSLITPAFEDFLPQETKKKHNKLITVLWGCLQRKKR